MKAISIIGLLFFSNLSNAQNSIQFNSMHLNQVIQMAVENAPTLKVNKLQEKYYSLLPSTANEIPKTQFLSELGNYNTSAFDIRLSIIQPLNAGAINQKQKLLFESFLATSQANTQVQIMDVKRIARSLYVQLQYFQANHLLLKQIDSIYAGYQKIASLRFEKGESNLLEKISLDNLVMQNKLMIDMQDVDKKTVQFQLGLLVQSELLINAADPLESSIQLFDTAQWKNNPYFNLYIQEQKQAIAETELAKARLKPEWLLGYNNQSINGWQMQNDRTESLYNMSNRFSSVTLGITVPVFNQNQKRKINAAKINEEVVAATSKASTISMQYKFDKAWQDYDKYTKAVSYYIKTANKQADIIINTANLSYKNGQINYIEWGTLLNQAISIKTQYLEVLRQINFAATELNYLLNN